MSCSINMWQKRESFGFWHIRLLEWARVDRQWMMIHYRSRPPPPSLTAHPLHPRAITKQFVVGRKLNGNYVENKLQMLIICKLFWKALYSTRQSPGQVLSHPYCLPPPSASCLALNFLPYKPFVASLPSWNYPRNETNFRGWTEKGRWTCGRERASDLRGPRGSWPVEVESVAL